MSNIEAIVFVYSNGSDTKCMYRHEAIFEGDILIKSGYKHTATLDPALWIQNLCNSKYPMEEIFELTIITKDEQANN